MNRRLEVVETRTMQRINDPSVFADLREEWDELLAASRADCFFLTWEWLHTWWEHLAGRRQLCLHLVRCGRELAAIAPLVQRPPAWRRLIPFRALEFLGTGTVGSDYLDVIIRSGREQETLDALADALAATRLTLEFGQVRRSVSFAAPLTQRLAAQGWSESETPASACPVIDLAGRSWESYLASLSSAHRYNFQRRLKNLERGFNVRLELVQTEAERREALDTLVALHTRRWDTRGGSEVFGSSALLAFHDEVSRLALQRGWLRLFVLRLDGRPAAVLYGFRYGRTFYFYQSGFDPTFAKESVGLVTMGLTIRQAITEGAAEFDLLHGVEPYKFHWMPEVRELAHFELFPPGPRGAVCRGIAIASGRIRRSARHLLGDVVSERIVSRGWVGLAGTLSTVREAWRRGAGENALPRP
jgi:CelD/BcsL family acetyltransferase involved in cellulose biosynthesis